MRNVYFFQILVKAFNKAMKSKRSMVINWKEGERKEDLFFHHVLAEEETSKKEEGK